MKKLILIAGLVAALAVAAPAFASVQNVKISGDIDSTFLLRDRFDLDVDSGGDQIQRIFITQTRLRVDADLSDNVGATVALINERAWGEQSYSSNTEVILNLAYVTLREMLYSPLTVVIGRQDFHYGNSFIMDSNGTNNSAQVDSGLNDVAEDLTKGTALDAIRFILDYNPLKIEAFWAKVDANTVTGLASSAGNDDDIDVYGVNATYEVGDSMSSVVETYLFVKKDQTTKDATDGSKTDVIKVVGIRGSTNPIEGLNVQAEWAHQGGTAGDGTTTNYTRNSQAVQGIVSYQVPVLKEYNPVLQYVFTKVLGNKTTRGTDDDFTAWDPFFENQGGGTIYNTLSNLSDVLIHIASLTVNPMEDVTAKVSYAKLWKEKDYDATTITLAQPDGSTSTSANTVSGKNGLGQEIDLNLTYDYTEDVKFGSNF